MKFVSYTYPWLENILKKEIEARKIKVLDSGPWFVKFEWNVSTMVKMNLWLRTANKVYLLLWEEKITDFDKLFDLVYSINWKYYIPKNFKININPHIVKSQLSHIPSIQSIVQKAIIKKLVWNENYSFDEDKNIEIRIDIFKDNLKVLLDTSWEALYKRWYKKDISKAGLKETLTAGILQLINCKDNLFFDPFCGSGTILIEKAMIDLNIAPWLKRNFLFEKFNWVDKNILEKEKWRAGTRRKEKNLLYFWYDIDPSMVEIARENIKNAGLEKYIKIEKKDFLDIDIKWTMLTNPPYNKRIKLENIDQIYNKLFNDLQNVNCGWVITWYENIDKIWFDNFKVRVLSNGWDKVKFFYK